MYQSLTVKPFPIVFLALETALLVFGLALLACNSQSPLPQPAECRSYSHCLYPQLIVWWFYQITLTVSYSVFGGMFPELAMSASEELTQFVLSLVKTQRPASFFQIPPNTHECVAPPVRSPVCSRRAAESGRGAGETDVGFSSPGPGRTTG